MRSTEKTLYQHYLKIEEEKRSKEEAEYPGWLKIVLCISENISRGRKFENFILLVFQSSSDGND